jgi:hypothetical protein
MLQGDRSETQVIRGVYNCIPGDRTDHVENLKKHGLGDGGVKLSDIEGGRGCRGRLGRRGVVGGGRWDRRGESTVLGNGNSLRLGNGRRRHEYMGFFVGVWVGRYCFVDFSVL